MSVIAFVYEDSINNYYRQRIFLIAHSSAFSANFALDLKEI